MITVSTPILLSNVQKSNILSTVYSLFIGGCSCADYLCIMAATINTFNPPQRWSSCSVATYNAAISRTFNNLARCLHNVPTDILGDPVCGNGILEEGEMCDCGSPQVSMQLMCSTNTVPVPLRSDFSAPYVDTLLSPLVSRCEFCSSHIL